MTKLLLAIAAVLAPLLSLSGCGGGGDSKGASTPASVANPVSSPAPAPAPAPDPAPGSTPTTVALTVTIEGSGRVSDSALGISCATSCVVQIASGASLALAATPDSGMIFNGWSGACSGTTTCSAATQSAMSVTARFAAPAGGPTAGTSLFDTITSPGTITVTLHPGSQVALGQTTKIAFGVPLPRGLVSSTATLRVLDDSGSEIPSAVSELSRWRTIAAGGAESVRSALFYIDVVFPARVPQTVRVQFGTARTQNLAGTHPGVTTLWTSIANGPVPDEYPTADAVREPIVYATLPAQWLGRALLLTRTTPTSTGSGLAWWDAGLTNFAKTAVNDVAATVSAANRINLIAEEPWLYDRALTLFNVYVRTGDINWLRRAHRAAQWYAGKVGTNGIFTLSSYNADLKYSYGMSLLTDFNLTGDPALRAPIERVAQAGVREWQATYSAGMSFWTERHHAYALLAALSAFEITGDRTHAQRATALKDLTLQMSNNAAKCPLHTVEQHEGDAGDTRQMCSPWMGALLTEAMLRYYALSEDAGVLGWLSGMGDYVRQYAMYDGGLESSELAGKLMPWYLAGPGGRVEDGRGYDDMEHACEVAGVMAKAAWAKKRMGQSSTADEQTADDLLATCQFVLNYWHRATPTLAEYRLTPPRKFSWWFGSSSDLGWMLGR